MDNKLEKAANIIKKGGLVIFPTETVYAIGANALDENAVEKIYIAKGRAKKNPINLLVSNIKMIENITEDITVLEYKIIEEFFPGPITIILKKKDCIPSVVTAGGDTVGIRMPANKIAIDLIEKAGVPVAAPSANISGKLSATDVDGIKKDFEGKVDLIIDGGQSKIGIESTIVKVINDTIHILRPGVITEKDLKRITHKVVCDYKEENNELPSADLKHYSLKTKTIVIYDENNKDMIEKINSKVKEFENSIVICSKENSKFYNAKNIIEYGEKKDLNNISKNLFKVLGEADKLNGDVIIIEGLKEEGISSAIMDRIKKVCM